MSPTSSLEASGRWVSMFLVPEARTMTITKEQLDELERKAELAKSMDDHGFAFTELMTDSPDVILQLIAIARAALALVARLECQGFVSRLSDAADPLYAALRGKP